VDTPLKQRLIGAIVLVALAVIFLPMLVKGPAPDSGVASVPIAAPDAPADGQFETRELPLVAPAGGATGLQTGQAKPLQETAAPATPPTVDTSPAVAAGNFAVTFGAYGSKADADAVIAYLQRSQLPGFAETTTISGRQAWRVRVGPYADRAQAEAAVELLERWAHGTATDATTEPLWIGQAAGLLGITTHMLRNWERDGLIQVPRDPLNGYRQYGTAEIGRLRVIRMLLRAGYSTMAILRMLLRLDRGQKADLRQVLDTPRPDEDVYSAADRWLSTLADFEQRAVDIIVLLESMIAKRQK